METRGSPASPRLGISRGGVTGNVTGFSDGDDSAGSDFAFVAVAAIASVAPTPVTRIQWVRKVPGEPEITMDEREDF